MINIFCIIVNDNYELLLLMHHKQEVWILLLSMHTRDSNTYLLRYPKDKGMHGYFISTSSQSTHHVWGVSRSTTTTILLMLIEYVVEGIDISTIVIN